MPQFFTLDKRKSSIAYVQKDGDQITLVHKNGRRIAINGTLDPNEFPLTEVDEATALALIKPEKPEDRPIIATVIETRSGTFTPASSLTNQDIDDLTNAIDDAIRKGKASTTADIRDVIVKALRKTPAVSPIP